MSYAGKTQTGRAGRVVGHPGALMDTVWCLVSGVWCLVSGVWCLVVWCLVDPKLESECGALISGGRTERKTELSRERAEDISPVTAPPVLEMSSSTSTSTSTSRNQ